MIANKSRPITAEDVFLWNIRHHRDLNKMTQADLARALSEKGIPFHQQTIQKIESGVRPLKLAEAFAIAECLGVTELDEMTFRPADLVLIDAKSQVEAMVDAAVESLIDFRRAQDILAMYADRIPEDAEDWDASAWLRQSAIDILRLAGEKWDQRIASQEEILERIKQQNPGRFDDDFLGESTPKGTPYSDLLGAERAAERIELHKLAIGRGEGHGVDQETS